MTGQCWTAVRTALVVMLVCLPMAACTISPYRIDIQQGNVVTQESISKLKPDMTRAQVKFVLGTPLVTDTFHPDRWDYFYKFDKAGNPREQRRLTLVFRDEKLQQILGDVAAADGLVGQAGRSDPAAPKK
jgi:outer membrane protein assembly factor BamE